MDQVGQATIDAVTENESALIRGARKVGRHLEGHEFAIGAEGMVIGEDVAGADNGINDAARAAADPNGGGSNGGAEVKLARRPDAWDEVGGGARESDVLPIGRDLGRFGTGGEGNGIGVGRAGAHECSYVALKIAQEHVSDLIGIGRQEVVGFADKGDVASIGSEDGAAA